MCLMHEIRKHVGRKIREFRKAEKLTQKELGEKIGVKHNTISSYEHGTNEPELDILYRMANVLDKNIDDFFPELVDGEDDVKQIIHDMGKEELLLIEDIKKEILQLEDEEKKELINNIKFAVDFFNKSR